MARLPMRLLRSTEPYVLSAPALLVIALLFLAPSVYNVILAFQHLSPYQSPQDATFAGLENFKNIWSGGNFWHIIFNTVFWLTFVTVAIRVVAGLAIALALESPILRRWRLLGLSRTLLLIPWMIPQVVAVAVWRWIFDGNSGVLNQFLENIGATSTGIPFLAQPATVWWAIVTIIVWRELPFVIMVLVAGLQSVPSEQYEAASIDGAGRRRTLLSITLPNLRQVITIVILVTVIQTFNNFVYVWLTTGGGPGDRTAVLATELYNAAFFDNNLGTGSAIGLFMTALMGVFALAYLYLSTSKEKS